jgi:7-carboxy-7-deazaguanine synthase
MPKGEMSNERFAIQPDQYRKYDNLPLVHTGCDSYASWDVRFKHLSPLMTTGDIAEKIVEMLPEKKWNKEHLVITGGEPLLGWQRAFPELLQHESMKNLKYVTFETNGTQKLSDDFKKFLFNYSNKYGMGDTEFTFSVSAKLSASGEKWEDAILPEVVNTYSNYGQVYLKFVIDKDTDIEEVERAVKAYRDYGLGLDCDVYLMPVGGTDVKYFSNYKQVAEMAMRKGWKYSPRLQVDIWRNAWGT